jgi:hypothetical protein
VSLFACKCRVTNNFANKSKWTLQEIVTNKRKAVSAAKPCTTDHVSVTAAEWRCLIMIGTSALNATPKQLKRRPSSQLQVEGRHAAAGVPEDRCSCL